MKRRHREKQDRSALPPRKKDWVEGHDQIGLFIRTKDGSVVEITWHKAPKEISRLAALMMADRLGVGIPEKRVEKVDDPSPPQ